MRRPFQTAGILVALLLVSPNAWSWEYENLRLRGRLQTRFEAKDQPEIDAESADEGGGGWESAFSLRRVRVDGRWAPADWARMVVEFEGAASTDLNTVEFSMVELKDAFGRIEIHPALVFHLGQFKKPFSRLKMESPFRSVVPSRGLLNRYAVARTSHGGYGGRDIGVMASGRLKKLARFNYYLGVFSGPGHIDGEEESHKDIVARIQVRPFKGCRLALNASHKLYHSESGALLTANLFGADARFKFGGFTLQLEGAYGDNVDAPDDLVNHRLWGTHGIASYALRISDELVLTPAFMAEVFDPDDQDDGGRVVRLAGGVNLDIGELMRVVLFAEGLLSGELKLRAQHDDGINDDFVSTRVMVQVNMVF